MKTPDYKFNQVVKLIRFHNLNILDSMKINNDLKSLKLKNIKLVRVKGSAEVQVTFEMTNIHGTADVYLFLNNRKKDMFYSITSGIFNFNLMLNRGRYSIKIFYVDCGYKSNPITRNILI